MRRVLEGGGGAVRGGILDRSSVRLDLREEDEEERDALGEGESSLGSMMMGGCVGDDGSGQSL